MGSSETGSLQESPGILPQLLEMVKCSGRLGSSRFRGLV